MPENNEGQYLVKSHLLQRYKQKRSQLEEKMRTRQGQQSEQQFQSSVSIATASLFREMMKADKDELTQLIKKEQFLKSAQIALDLVNRQGGSVDIYTIDLCGFKKLNDSLGHEKGDTALKGIAAFLPQIIRSYDVVGRLGGDEFGIIQIGVEEKNPEIVANRLEEALRKNPKKIDGLDLLSASIGVAKYKPGDERVNAEELLKRSDVAMYNAKTKPGTHVVIWKQGMNIPPDASSRR